MTKLIYDIKPTHKEENNGFPLFSYRRGIVFNNTAQRIIDLRDTEVLSFDTDIKPPITSSKECIPNFCNGSMIGYEIKERQLEEIKK